MIFTEPKWLNIEESVNFRNECQRKVLKDRKLPEDFLSKKEPATKNGSMIQQLSEIDKEEIISRLSIAKEEMRNSN